MNILIPHHWLLEHLDTKATPKKLADCLSLCGPSVERIDTIEGEPVYDIEVTTNRVDSMSVRGIAREAATILPEFGIKASLKPLSTHTPTKLNKRGKSSLTNPGPQSTDLPKLDLIIKNDPKLCHRILALKMSVSRVGESPQWLKKRLLQVGQRPLNNLIDITNYAMWELGHPIHVFDFDRLLNGRINVRQAKPGEKFTTLDNKTHTAGGGEVVFDDGTGVIVDLPGIMGTKNTVVTDKTKTILVWIEDVDARKIRDASMGLDIRTQAAVLNEKNVDRELGLPTFHFAAHLYTKLAGAKPLSRLYDDYPVKQQLKPTTLTQSQLDTYLSIAIKPIRVKRILETLGCQVVIQKTNQAKNSPNNIQDTSYNLTPPTWRAKDLRIPQDYIEEVARIYGYHNLPSNLMATPIPDVTTNLNHHLEHQIKSYLADWGATEVYTYSLVSKDQALQSGHPLKDHLKLKNPLTDDLVYLRRSLVLSHLEVLTTNKPHRLTVFELANTYIPQTKNKLPIEQLELVVSSNQPYTTLKGLLDALAFKLHLDNYRLKPKLDTTLYPEFDPKKSGTIYSGKHRLGVIGTVKLGFFSARLNALALMSQAKTHPAYVPLASTTPIIEDLTLSLPPKTSVGLVLEAITKKPNITSATLKEIYQTNYTFTISYDHPSKQLTDQDIKPLRAGLVKDLQKSFSARLIGQL